MARKRERAFALFFAGLFLLTSSALTIGVIYTLVQQHRKPADSAATTPPTADTTKPTEAKKMDPNAKLTGTKLQNFTPATTPQKELQTSDSVVGTGAEVKPGDTITADYVGALMSDGTIFDAAADHGGPISFSLNGVIQGWSKAIPGMKVGGTRRLLIPASLAYGSQGNSGIPPNADLVFDVTVTKIGK